MKRLALPVLFLGFLLVLNGCAKKGEKIIARVGDHQITLSEFERRWEGGVQKKFSSREQELDIRRKTLDLIIDDKLMIIGAYEQKLDESPDVKKQLEDGKPRSLLQVLYEKEVKEKAEVSKAEVKRYYDQLKFEVRARHILVNTEEEAKKVKEELDKGSDFAQLAKEKSIDPRTKDKGGDLGFFKWGKMVGPFQEVAFRLKPGGVSPPVKSQFGWHIIKVEEKREAKREPFDKMQSQIESQLKGNKQRERVGEYMDQVKERANLNFVPKALKLVVSKAKETKGKIELTDEEKKTVLVKYSSGEWTLGRFADELAKVGPFRHPKFENEGDVQNFVERALMQDLLIDAAKREGIESTREFKKALKESEEKILLTKMQREVIPKDVTVSDEEIKDYYQSNQDKFKVAAQVSVREIQVKTKEEAEKLLKRIKRGASFKKLAKEKSLRKWAAQKDGEMGYFEERRYPELFKAAWNLKEGQLAGPIKTRGDNWSVIKLIGKKEEKLQPLKEAEEKAKNWALADKRKNVKADWLENMRKKVKITIDEELLESTVQAEG